MSRPPIGSDWLHAGALVNGATGASVSRSNLVSARTSIGVYSLALDQPIGESEAVAIVSLAGAAAGADITSALEHTSDTIKTVFLTSGGVPIDSDFSVSIFRLQVDRAIAVPTPEQPYEPNAIERLSVAFVNLTTVSIGPGSCRSSDNSFNLINPTTVPVDLSVDGVGGLDTGIKMPSTWYFVYLIGDSTGINPIAGLFSASPTTPTMPPGYDKLRRVGSAYFNAAAVFEGFVQYGGASDRMVIYSTTNVGRSALIGGAAVVSTPIALRFVPPTTQFALLQLSFTGVGIFGFFQQTVGGPILHTLFDGQALAVEALTDPTPSIAYFNSAPGGLANVGVCGYREIV